jgi:hypothetical protein
MLLEAWTDWRLVISFQRQASAFPRLCVKLRLCGDGLLTEAGRSRLSRQAQRRGMVESILGARPAMWGLQLIYWCRSMKALGLTIVTIGVDDARYFTDGGTAVRSSRPYGLWQLTHLGAASAGTPRK